MSLTGSLVDLVLQPNYSTDHHVYVDPKIFVGLFDGSIDVTYDHRLTLSTPRSRTSCFGPRCDQDTHRCNFINRNEHHHRYMGATGGSSEGSRLNCDWITVGFQAASTGQLFLMAHCRKVKVRGLCAALEEFRRSLQLCV